MAPTSEPVSSRPTRAAVVGAGFSGIAMAIALRRAGLEEVVVFDRADELGGVWAHNTYPGAACDVPSYVYSYSFAQRRDWSRPCSPQHEIQEYLREVAREHGVLDDLLLRTEITEAIWEEDALGWTLEAADGRRFEADVLILACGQLTRPAIPDIPGAETFAGHSFHSAEWDHDYAMAGRSVAVVGTGASAVQFVPPLAEEVAQLHVYQRSAPYMLPRANAPYPAVVRGLIEHVPGAQTVRREGGKLLLEGLIAGLTIAPPIRWGVEGVSRGFMWSQVRDGELRAKVTPDYPLGCKRILFSSAYLPALGRDNVSLVDDRIERITARGILTEDGIEREVDCIVWGTGFATDFVAPMQVRGTGGRELADAWSDGPEAHHGITVSGFPNMFLLYGPNTNLGVGSIVEMIEAQVGYVMDALAHLEATGAAALDVEPEVQAASCASVQERLQDSIWTACSSWYRDAGGRVTGNWPGFMREYARKVRRLDPEEYAFLEHPSAAARTVPNRCASSSPAARSRTPAG